MMFDEWDAALVPRGRKGQPMDDGESDDGQVRPPCGGAAVRHRDLRKQVVMVGGKARKVKGQQCAAALLVRSAHWLGSIRPESVLARVAMRRAALRSTPHVHACPQTLARTLARTRADAAAAPRAHCVIDWAAGISSAWLAASESLGHRRRRRPTANPMRRCAAAMSIQRAPFGTWRAACGWSHRSRSARHPRAPCSYKFDKFKFKACDLPHATCTR